MQININELEKIVSILFSNIKEKNGSEIELKSDYYWDISNKELYNPYETPSDLSLGQLSDDLNEVMRLKKEDNAISYDLQRIANLLRAISFENQI